MPTYTHVQQVRLLYKMILRLHRGLPDELQCLGNVYAREEFKRHKTCSQEQAETFLTEWAGYAVTIAKQLGIKGPHTATDKFGKQLQESDLGAFRDDQIQQLYELMLAAKQLDKESEAKEKNS